MHMLNVIAQWNKKRKENLSCPLAAEVIRKLSKLVTLHDSRIIYPRENWTLNAQLNKRSIHFAKLVASLIMHCTKPKRQRLSRFLPAADSFSVPRNKQFWLDYFYGVQMAVQAQIKRFSIQSQHHSWAIYGRDMVASLYEISNHHCYKKQIHTTVFKRWYEKCPHSNHPTRHLWCSKTTSIRHRLIKCNQHPRVSSKLSTQCIATDVLSAAPQWPSTVLAPYSWPAGPLKLAPKSWPENSRAGP